MPKPILVVGAAHLDIVGDYDSSVRDVIDKPGTISYSIGGTAYNVSTNLAQNGSEVAIATALSSTSIIAPIIIQRLIDYNINVSNIIQRDDFEESGFLAQREHGELRTAVTASTMDSFVTAYAPFETLISDSSIVVCDCNMSSIVLNEISIFCNRIGKKLFVAAVSEAKVLRIRDIDRTSDAEPPIFLISMNMMEAKAIVNNIEYVLEKRTELLVKDVCREFGATYVIITKKHEGYLVLSSSGMIYSFEAPRAVHIVSQTGAGDALLAAVVSYYSRANKFDWPEVSRVVSRFVTEVLKQRGATVGSHQKLPHPKIADFVEENPASLA